MSTLEGISAEEMDALEMWMNECSSRFFVKLFLQEWMMVSTLEDLTIIFQFNFYDNQIVLHESLKWSLITFYNCPITHNSYS